MKNSSKNPIIVSKSLDPDQARHLSGSGMTFVWFGLLLNCLQKLSADDTKRQKESGDKNSTCLLVITSEI